MLDGMAKVQLPDYFSRICKLDLKNTRISYGEVTDILQSDQFVRVFLSDVFAPYLKKGGTLGMLTALGWEGLRNRLAELIIQKYRTGRYSKNTELDEVHDVIDIEKRFQFLCPENNSRLFLFGLYLKLSDIEAERSNNENLENLITISPEIDELLIKGKSKINTPDWLLCVVWGLFNVVGAQRAISLLTNHSDSYFNLLDEISEQEHDDFINILLDYAFAINDTEFLTASKVY